MRRQYPTAAQQQPPQMRYAQARQGPTQGHGGRQARPNPKALYQEAYTTQKSAMDAYQQRYQMSQQEIQRRKSLLQSQNMQAAQAALRAPMGTTPTQAPDAPRVRHKLYVKSKDANCEFAYDFFAKRYNKDGQLTQKGMPTDGYTKVTKRENLSKQIEVINVLRQPELKPGWLRGVPCLLKHNPQNDSWKEYYGSECMKEMHRIAHQTPPDVNTADVLTASNKQSGFAINNTYEYLDDPRYSGTGKVTSEEMEYIKQARDRQNSMYQSQQRTTVQGDFNMADKDTSQRINYNEYISKRAHVPAPTKKPLERPEMVY